MTTETNPRGVEVERRPYSTVTVFCPSDPIIVDGRYSYFDIGNDSKGEGNIYVGGEVRMQAAARLCSQTKVVIVVGGSKPKVDGMRDYLLQEMQETGLNEQPKIIRVESDPDTLGNLRAIKKANFGGRAGLLTNSYHLVRIMRMVENVLPGRRFHSIVAESFMGWNALQHPDEFTLRLRREVEGLLDWETGVYLNQANTNEAEWKCVVSI